MQKRIFVAINLPRELKDEILNWEKGQKNLVVRWTKPNNTHITLVFIGNITENETERVISAAQLAVKGFKPFEIAVDRISIGPSLDKPRMIWLSGQENKNLSELSRHLVQELKNVGIAADANHNFTLHITLARARNDELQGVKLDKKFEHSFIANSVEIMESKLSPAGPAYNTLESIKLNLSG